MTARAFLLVLARRIAPGVALLGPAEEARFFAIIDEALDARPRAVRWQLRAFLWLLRWAPVARYARRFDRLPPDRQDSVLRWFERSRLLLARRGFWGLRTLILMGYYAREEAGVAVGWRPDLDGNRRLARAD